MYAERRYEPRQSRSVSLGAAFLINGAVIAGIALMLAPKIAMKDPVKVLIGENVPIEVPPPPIDEPKPKPKVEPRISEEPLVVAPKPFVASETPNTLATTGDIPRNPPTFDTAEKLGPETVPEARPTPPLPALVLASQDLRYLRDFQPPYPAAELRAQRDGVVRLKVLIGIDGRVKAVEQLSATSPAFFDATRRQALAKWRFKPATRGDVPEESWKTMTVRFNITDQ